MAKSTVSFRIVIDHDRNTVTVNETGRKCPLSMSFGVDPDTVAAAYRDLSFYILEASHGIEHCREFTPPMFTDEEARKTAVAMLDEHRSIFDGGI